MQALIIDWPQYVRTDHPNAVELLERDVGNVLVFFNRRFRVKTSLEKIMQYVSGKTRALSLKA